MPDMLSWNNSSLSLLQRCGEAYRRRYIEKESIPPAPRMLRGTVVHRAASAALLRKMEQHTLPTTAEARDLAATEFEQAWAGGVTLSAEETGEGVGTVRGRSKDFAVDLAGFHVDRVAPGITPIGVERRIVVKPRDSDLEIHGTIDLIDQTPTGEVIHDLKTSEKSPNRDAADTSQQLSMYALIRTAEVGVIPERLILDYLVRTPAKLEKKHVVLETQRSAEDLGAMVARINVAVESVRKGSFLPAPSDAWWCAPSYCDFFPSCRYVTMGARRLTQ